MSITRALMAAAGNAGAAEPTDPYFYDVTMLLTGDGTNGAQNNTFLDSSTNNFSITRNGNTTQGTFTPYGSLWSNYLPSTANIAVSTANAAFALGTGDFTIEGWFNLTNPTYAQGLFHINTAVSATVNGYAVGITSAGLVQFYSGTTFTTTNATLSANTWYHIALVRSSGTVKVYVNGVNPASGGSIADSQSLGNSVCYVGLFYNTSGYTMTGYASNFRVVKGTAVYTIDFTPPTTPLTAIANTSFLTCQSNRFIDNSTNALSLTLTGAPSVQRFSPFNPTAAYSTATIGGSGYFDGSGDYLNVAYSSAFTLSGDFTAECWFNTGTSSENVIFGIGGDSSGLVVDIYNGATYCYMVGVGNLLVSAISPNTWYHLAVVRSGSGSGNVTLYLNGVSKATTTNTSTVNAGDGVGIGYPLTGTSFPKFNGYMTDFRITKGVAVYTGAFTPPTLPLKNSGAASAACYPSTTNVNTSFASSDCSLLTGYTNAGIPDNAMMNDLETFGNAQISTSVKKYGTGSLAFDGSDVLVSNAPSTDLCAFGTGDYTIEMWVYFVNASTLGVFYDSRPTSTNGFYPTLYVSSGNIYFYFNSANEGSAAVSTGQWYHLAVCRSSGTVKMFLNGTQSATWADTRAYSNGSGRPYIGGSGYGGGVGDGFNGYIDDLRVTKGYARYTSNFTAPTAAFPTY